LRIVRQLLAESMAYALVGGAGGVLLAYWLIDAVIAVIGPAVPRLTETTLDLRVLAVAAAISFCSAPARQSPSCLRMCRRSSRKAAAA
jgi:hypothetical protein